MEIEVADFEWDWDEGGNVDHVAKHGVYPEDVSEVKNSNPRFGLNDPEKSATHVMIGTNPVPDAIYTSRWWRLLVSAFGSQ